MADDLVPIQLSLTAGDLVTLWAPAWHKDGEVWQAFLGSGDDIFVFPEVEQMVDFVRKPRDHDLVNHPRWPKVMEASVDDLTPRHNHYYNITGVPTHVNRTVDVAPIAVLARIIELVKSFADVCELGSIRETLDMAPGFDRLERGSRAFTGRRGLRDWAQMQDVVANEWKQVVATLDRVVVTPEVGPAADA